MSVSINIYPPLPIPLLWFIYVFIYLFVSLFFVGGLYCQPLFKTAEDIVNTSILFFHVLFWDHFLKLFFSLFMDSYEDFEAI